MRIKESHSCKQHQDICTFSKYAKFCCGVDASQPLDIQLATGETRGRCFSTRSMTYYVLGALRGNALKRLNDHEKRYPKPQAHTTNSCFSEDDSPSEKNEKLDFKLKVYKPYWTKASN
jgi:hypothetical protein